MQIQQALGRVEALVSSSAAPIPQLLYKMVDIIAVLKEICVWCY